MKTILITGSNRGIGFEIARQLGIKGHRVIVSSRFYVKAEEAWKALNMEGIEAQFVQLDVTDTSSIAEAFKKIKERLGSIDVLINNAGVLIDGHSGLLDTALSKVYFTLQTNAVGPLAVIRTFLPIIAKGGRIVNISSGMGTFANGPIVNASIYATSKTLLNLYTKQLAEELKKEEVVINAVCPGWVRSSMGGESAPRSLEEGAETPVWLAIDAPSDINGKFIRDKEEIAW
jgi:NAD(P)-dependent dehydrogenase (short-subunit alcohol dehydrogenase family)